MVYLGWVTNSPATSAAPDEGPRKRLSLLPHEAAVVLDCSEREARRLIASGDLPNASRDRFLRIGVEELGKLVAARVEQEELGPLSPYLLEEIAARRLRVPRGRLDRLALVTAHLGSCR